MTAAKCKVLVVEREGIWVQCENRWSGLRNCKFVYLSIEWKIRKVDVRKSLVCSLINILIKRDVWCF